MKKQIVFLDFDDIKNPLLGAGQARATFEVGKRLVDKGYGVSVFCSKYPGSRDRVEEGINYKHIGFTTNNIKINNIIYILTLPFFVKSIKADLIIECFTAPISTLFSPIFTKIPVVAKPTSFEADKHSKRYKIPFYLIERFGLKFYKYFMAYSKDYDLKFRKINPKIDSHFITEGVDQEYFKVQRKKGEYILYLGRLDVDQKGLDLLLFSYSKIKNNIKLPLVIAGNGPDEQIVKNLILKYKLSKKVKLIGPTFGLKKVKVMEKAAFVVIPSRYEGFCLFALEALASGLSVISFDIPGLSWMDDRVAIKIKPFDCNYFAEKMLDLTRKNLIKNKNINKNFAKNFTWEKVTHEYINYFKYILKKERLSL